MTDWITQHTVKEKIGNIIIEVTEINSNKIEITKKIFKVIILNKSFMGQNKLISRYIM